MLNHKRLQFIISAFILFIPCIGWSQNAKEPIVFITQFKNNAQGAYTLIHDDFGGSWAHGIEDFADTIAANRKIAFCFAAITGECDVEDWKNANRLISHGHQIVNHSMYHKCGKETNWCTSGTWDEHDFSVEIDKSTKLIQTNTGKHPAFFMFPFDLHTDTMINYLQSKSYCGARAGTWGLTETNSEESSLFRLNFKPFPPGQILEDLNNFCLEAERKKAWAIREVHGVNDQSWSSIPLNSYTSHIEFLKSQTSQNLLWVATLSDVLYYTLIRQRFTPFVSKLGINQRAEEISFRKTSNSLISNDKTWKKAQETSHLKTVTIAIASVLPTISAIKQEGNTLNFWTADGMLFFEANPENGKIQISYK